MPRWNFVCPSPLPCATDVYPPNHFVSPTSWPSATCATPFPVLTEPRVGPNRCATTSASVRPVFTDSTASIKLTPVLGVQAIT